MPTSRRGWALALGLLLGQGCAVLQVHQEPTELPARDGRWLLLPLINQGEAPRAAERVEDLLLTLMRSDKGVALAHYRPALPTTEPRRDADGEARATEDAPFGELLGPDDQAREERVLAWARAQRFRYALGGSVHEWRYRSAQEGEAAVGVTLRVIDLTSSKVLFSASGSRAGWGRDTLTGTAQVLLRSMLARLGLR